MNKDWIARELTIEMVVGAFIVMVFLGLGYFTILLSDDLFGGEKWAMEVCFKNVMGLKAGDTVVSRGMNVGQVKELKMQPNSDRVIVVLRIDQPIQLRLKYRIRIVATTLLGGRYLQIDEGEGAPVPEGHVLQGVEPLDFMQDAAEIISATKEGVVEGKIIDNLVVASEQFREITARLNSGEGLIASLLAKDSKLYQDVSVAATSLRAIGERLQKGEGTLGRFLAEDEQLYEDLAETVASLKSLAQRIEEGKGTVGRLLSEDDQVYKDLVAATTSLRKVAARIENGDGTIGRLAVDDELYQEVEALVGEVRAVVDDYRETAPIVTFSSIFFGAF